MPPFACARSRRLPHHRSKPIALSTRLHPDRAVPARLMALNYPIEADDLYGRYPFLRSTTDDAESYSLTTSVINSALHFGEQQLIIEGVNYSDELCSALLAFDAVAFEAAAVDRRDMSPAKYQLSGTARASNKIDAG